MTMPTSPHPRTMSAGLSQGHLAAADAEFVLRREWSRYMTALARHALIRLATRLAAIVAHRGPVTPRAA